MSNHPLYPEENKELERKIHLYIPKACEICGNVNHSVEWVEYEKTINNSFYFSVGSTFTVKKMFKKLCKGCLRMETSPEVWG